MCVLVLARYRVKILILLAKWEQFGEREDILAIPHNSKKIKELFKGYVSELVVMVRVRVMSWEMYYAYKCPHKDRSTVCRVCAYVCVQVFALKTALRFQLWSWMLFEDLYLIW